MRQVTTDTAQIELPTTSNRKLEQSLRVRPGDTVLLAGIQQSRDDRSVQGLPGKTLTLLPYRNDSAADRSELVIAIRPRVIAYIEEGDQIPSQQPAYSQRSVPPARQFAAHEPSSDVPVAAPRPRVDTAPLASE